jgi:hypothetical protein
MGCGSGAAEATAPTLSDLRRSSSEARHAIPRPLARTANTETQVDPLETKLKRQVCKRVITLARARAAIRKFKNENG